MGRHRWTEARRALTAIFAGALAFGLLGGVLLSAAPSAGATTAPATSSPGLHTHHSEKPHHRTPSTSGSPSGHHAAAVRTIAVPPGTPSLFVTNTYADSVTAYPTSGTGNVSPAAEATSMEGPAGEAFDAAGDLWVANYTANTLVEYTPSQLAATGSPSPHVTLSSTALDAPTGIVFDAAGDLWVANFTANTLVEFTASQLAAGGPQAPAVTLTNNATSLDGPAGLATDTAGDLWVSNFTANTLVEFTPSQLAASGSPAPTLTLTATATSLTEPSLMTFDGSGNLWVANTDSSTVVEIAKTTPGKTGTEAASPTVTLTSATLTGPAGLAFDAAGDLWVANNSGDSVVEFAPTALKSGGTHPGNVLLVANGATSLDEPYGIAFDSAGNLWVANTDGDNVVELTSTVLGTSGTANPGVTLSSVLESPGGAALDNAGNLWVSNFETDSVVEYTTSGLASGVLTPKVVLTGIDGSSDVAFDGTGNLWVSLANTVIEIAKATLASSGMKTPKLTLESTSLMTSIALAFDASGNLWVANGGEESGSVVEFAKGLLAASGTVSTTATVTLMLTSHFHPGGLAFDAAGDLWVSTFDFTFFFTTASHSRVLELTPTALSTSGTVTPKATLTSDAATSIDGPAGLAFDATGDLWVANNFNSSVVEFTPGELAGTGAPVPASVIGGPTTGLYGPWGIALFTPAASTTAVQVAPASVTQGTAVTYSATVTGGSGTPTGTVAFSVGGTSLCTATLSGGSGSCTATGAPVGADTVTGAYSGDATHKASQGTATLAVTAKPVTKATSSTHSGYWLDASDGGIFTFGTAGFYGSEGGKSLSAPIVGMAATPLGKGYWLVAADGTVYTFGTAPFYGSMSGQHLDAPIVGMAATSHGTGYRLVASDGGVFTFGSAGFYGSMGGKPLNAKIVGMAATSTGKGYWEVASDGGVFTFGTAGFYGSMGGKPLDEPIVGMAATPTGGGYWEVASDGGVFTFGDAPFLGSEGGKPLNAPVVGMAPWS